MVVGVSTGTGKVPSSLPLILKDYTKSAIRTQPSDLISWSHAYFQCLVEGENPPVKEQVEYPLPDNKSGITPGLLRVLHKKFTNRSVTEDVFKDFCTSMGVKEFAVNEAWKNSGSAKEKNWDELLVQMVVLEYKTPKSQLVTLVETSSEDLTTKGVPIETAVKYLAQLEKISGETDGKFDSAVEYIREAASHQDGMIYVVDLNRSSFTI